MRLVELVTCTTDPAKENCPPRRTVIDLDRLASVEDRNGKTALWMRDYHWEDDESQGLRVFSNLHEIDMAYDEFVAKHFPSLPRCEWSGFQ